MRIKRNIFQVDRFKRNPRMSTKPLKIHPETRRIIEVMNQYNEWDKQRLLNIAAQTQAELVHLSKTPIEQPVAMGLN